MAFSPCKDNSPFIAKINLSERFNDMIKNEEGYGFRKLSNPCIIRSSKQNEQEEENINNENISSNLSEKEVKNIIPKKLVFDENEKDNNLIKNNEIILESNILIPEITKIYKKARKFDYNFDLINIDFKDFINNFSFENKENDNNIYNISNNIINDASSDNLSKKKYKKQSFSNIPQTTNNIIENKNSEKYIIMDNGKKQINKNSIKCTCKNSFCLKFYCECFANGKTCENCFCCNCKNKPEFENLRQEKYKNILSRNPKAIYKINSIKKSWTCNCKNSYCKKKYCDCFHNGKFCTSKCKCVNCLNKIVNINKDNNNFGKIKKIKRIRGGKKFMRNNIFITPKKKRTDRNHKIINNNQSIADLTENNNKKNIFNNFSNKWKFKEVSQKLNMN